MFRTAIFAILFFCAASSFAYADEGIGCNPPGSKVAVLYGPCAGKRQTTNNQQQSPLASPEDDLPDRLTDAMQCEVGRAVLASRGRKTIEDLQIKIQIANKVTRTDTDTNTLGGSVSPFPNVVLGGSIAPGESLGDGDTLSLGFNPATASQLVSNLCSKSVRIGWGRGTRWQTRFTNAVSKYRRGKVISISADVDFSVTKTVTSGVNLQFFLSWSVSHQSSKVYDNTMKIRIGDTKAFGA